MEESTGSKLDLEVYVGNPRLLDVDGLPAALLVAVPLDVHDPVEVLVAEVYVNQNTISQTVHLQK